MFEHTKKFISQWMDDTCPKLKAMALKVKKDLAKIYKDAKEDYDKKKRS
jgi:hypothetical protein